MKDKAKEMAQFIHANLNGEYVQKLTPTGIKKIILDLLQQDRKQLKDKIIGKIEKEKFTKKELKSKAFGEFTMNYWNDAINTAIQIIKDA